MKYYMFEILKSRYTESQRITLIIACVHNFAPPSAQLNWPHFRLTNASLEFKSTNPKLTAVANFRMDSNLGAFE